MRFSICRLRKTEGINLEVKVEAHSIQAVSFFSLLFLLPDLFQPTSTSPVFGVDAPAFFQLLY